MIIWGCQKPWKGPIFKLWSFYLMIWPLVFLTDITHSNNQFQFEKFVNDIGFLLIVLLILFSFRYNYRYYEYFKIFKPKNNYHIDKSNEETVMRILIVICISFTIFKIVMYGF